MSMSRKFPLLLLAGVIAISSVYLLYMPRSPESAKQRAIDEFSYFGTDNRIDLSKFHGPELVFRDEEKSVFEWTAQGYDDVRLHVRVPNKRIGEFTFGVLGENVTIGNIGGNASQFFDTK